MRLGVLGGTFDPIHAAHVFMGAQARHQFGLDLVLYPVANAPWQKSDRHVTAPEDRYAMVEAALDGIDGLEPSRVEIDRGGTTYTADTVADLAREYDDPHLFLIVGTDVADDLHTWERIDEVRRAVTLVVALRPGAPPTRLEGWDVEHIEAPLLDLSSTDLRRRLLAGQPVDGLVPAPVVRLIAERALYAGPG